MTVVIPALATDRLNLRHWQRQDFEPLAAFLADGHANRYRGPARALSLSESWNYLCETIGQWQLRGYGIFAIEQRATGVLAGWSGLWHPIELPEPELAWTLFPSAQGKGLATEAARCVQHWAARDLQLPSLFSFVHPQNKPSRRLAERLGAVIEKETEFRSQPRLVYRHVLGGSAEPLKS
ncbi:MAG TPA: GNAT family N-acetyltransferase [Hyphomicrobiaceae bacterium]|nr:GNAT family N-acetyltransferase [Hyphomicrobiaceae bacterium]